MNKRTMKKGLAIVLALVMVFAMTATAFAATGNGYYLIGGNGGVAKNMSTDPVTVKVVFESRQYSVNDTSHISDVINVQVTSKSDSNEGFTVRDAVLAVNSSSAGITCLNEDGAALSTTDKYIKSISKESKIYDPVLPIDDPRYELDGWMFRVNGKLPISTLNGGASVAYGPKGTDISDTPIYDGDVIHFYWDYPYNETQTSYYSTHYITADSTYNNGVLDIQLKESYSWFANSGYWNITDFANYSPAAQLTATVYNAQGGVIGTGTINSDGAGTISGITLTSGVKYYIKVNSTAFKDVEGMSADYEDVTWRILNTTMVYEKIVA